MSTTILYEEIGLGELSSEFDCEKVSQYDLGSVVIFISEATVKGSREIIINTADGRSARIQLTKAPILAA